MSGQLTAVPVAPGTTVHFETGDIPAYVRRNVAQIVFAEVHRYFEDPAVKADYERWKAERYAKKGAAAHAQVLPLAPEVNLGTTTEIKKRKER